MSICFSEIDPHLAQLGQMVGLLSPVHGGEGYCISDSWFSDPINEISKGIRSNPAAFAGLLAALLGEVAGHALGVPTKDPGLLGSWYPIPNPATGMPTGLYIVAVPIDGAESQIFGIGVMHHWPIPSDAEANDVVLDVSAFGLLPLMKLGDSALEPVIGKQGYPITVGVSAAGAKLADGQPLVEAGAFSFNGVTFGAGLDVANSDKPFDLNIVVNALQLPGETRAKDRSLADLLAIPAIEIIETAASLFATALAKVLNVQGGPVDYLLPLVGLGSVFPSSDQFSTLPPLRWDTIATAATEGDPGRPFRDWFRTLAADTSLLQAWLTALAGFMGSTNPKLTGDGSRSNPIAVPILTVSSVGSLEFTLSTSVDANGTRSLFPGLSFSAVPFRFDDVAQLTLAAKFELAEFELSQTSAKADPTSLGFSVGFSLQNPVADKPLIAYDNYGCLTLTGGVSIANSDGLKVVPKLELTGVEIPDNRIGTVNLLSPSSLSNAAGDVLSSAIQTALNELFALAGTPSDAAISTSILLGIAKPNNPAWPATLEPPLSAGQLINTLPNPIGALETYYSNIAAASINGATDSPLSLILQACANLLSAATGSVSIEITGGGTKADPWAASLQTGDTTLPAHLVAWLQTDVVTNTVEAVSFGFQLTPSLTVEGTQIAPSLVINLLDLRIADGLSGVWLPGVEAAIALPDGFTSPKIADATFEISKASLSAGWRQSDGWFWSLVAGEPSLTVGSGPKLSVGQSLDFSNQSGLDDLVTSAADTFAPIFVGLMGVALLSVETRPGLAFTALMGLLPDVSGATNCPKGLDWPKDLPALDVSSLFTDPREALRDRIAALFASRETAAASLSAVSWAFSPALTEAPKITGTLDFGAPLRVPVGSSGFDVNLWFQPTGATLGLGLGRTETTTYGANIEVTFAARVNAVEVALGTGQPVNGGQAPSASFVASIANPNGPLIPPTNGAQLGSLDLGFELTIADTGVVVQPIVTLRQVQLPGGQLTNTLTLDEFQAQIQLQQAFLTLLNDAITKLVEPIINDQGFQTTYSLLTALGLATPKAQGYGVNPGGWLGLLADPTGYACSHILDVLTNTDLRKSLFDTAQSVLGLDIPTPPKAVLALLQALEVIGPAERGYPILPNALLDLARSPFDSLVRRAEAVSTDPSKRATLVAALVGETKISFPSQKPLFEVSLVQGTSIQVRTVVGAFVLGDVLGFDAGMSFNLANLTLLVDAGLGLSPVGLTLTPTLSVGFGPTPQPPTFAIDLVWSSGTKPAAIPLRVFPFDQATFLGQVKALAPVYALDVLAGAALQSKLVAEYPLPRIILQGLGIVEGAEEGPWTVVSLSGLLRDPMGWLLSDEVLGYQGTFAVGSFAKIVQRLAEAAPQGWTSSNGIEIVADQTTLSVSGLPYHFGLSFATSDTQLALTATTGGFDIAGKTAQLQRITAGVTLTSNFQPGIIGDVSLGSSAGVGWFVETGYDKGFELSVGQGSVSQPAGLQLQVLPFLGWGNLAEAATRVLAPQLLELVVPKIIEGLANSGSASMKSFANALSKLGSDLELSTLVECIAAVDPFTAPSIEKAALGWLLECFNPSNKAKTADALVTVFNGVLPSNTLSSQAGLVLYTPSEDIPLIIQIGTNADNLVGLWAEFTVPKIPQLKVALAPTGLGMALAQGSTTPVFSFGVDMTLPIDGSVGPQLSIGVSSGRFSFGIDPLGDSSDPAKHSSLYRELAPSFFGGGDTGSKVESWASDVVVKVLPRYALVVLLNLAPVKSWLDAPMFPTPGSANRQGPTPVAVLQATQLITASGTAPNLTYALNSLDNLAKITVTAFIANLIRGLLSTELTVLTFDGSKGTLVVGPSPVDASAYGLRVAVHDMEFAALPYIRFQLGATNIDWFEDASDNLGKLAKAPGLSVYIPVSGSGDDVAPDFDRTQFNLINAGLDFVGKAGAPIVSMRRFELGAIEPRGLLAMNLTADGVDVSAFGGMLTLADMMLSLAPNTLTPSGGGNPVAQNLLGSGTTDAANPPANPSFSLTAGYVRDTSAPDKGGLVVDLVGSEAGKNQVVVQVQRNFGPLFVGSVGLGWQQSKYLLDVLFTGNVSLAGLEIDLIGLDVGIPVTTLTDLSKYELSLAGLDVSFAGGPVTISGGLLKTEPPLMYTGACLISATRFSIVAAGSYTQLPNGDGGSSPSMFIFGALNMPLGGIPAFFVIGLAAGFGYNRTLELPSVGEVQNFPLLSGVAKGSFTEGESADSALQKLNDSIAPSIGEYWVAAGLRFTTFAMLDTLALLFVKFGREFEIDLIGLSTASLPPKAGSLALAYIELAIKVTINPTVGFVSAEAQLTPSSYIITKDCKLTGGFAFYLWFLNQKAPDGTPISAGDFVITLGGYHPAFEPPSYYPKVPRLGFSWLIPIGDAGKVQISGGAYFALVSGAVMAGGYLKTVFELGPLRAWFDAAANFLIEWQPFYFDVDIHISVGIEFHTKIAGVSVSLSVEMGAQLNLKGPPTHGSATVDWYIISFTIPIGDDHELPSKDALSWDRFQQQLLPSAEPPSGDSPPAPVAVAMFATKASPAANSGNQVVKLSATTGLLQGPGEADNSTWRFQLVPFGFTLASAIPISKVSALGLADINSDVQVGVRPMDHKTLDAPLTIEIIEEDGTTRVNLADRKISFSPNKEGAPAALWGRTYLDKTRAPNATEMMIDGALVGGVIAGDDYLLTAPIKQFPLANVAFDHLNGVLPYYLTPSYPRSKPYSPSEQAAAMQTMQATIMAVTVIGNRNAVLAALRSVGLTAPASPNLIVMHTSASDVLQAPPVLARIGNYLAMAGAVDIASPEVAGVFVATAEVPPIEPEFVAVRRSYIKTTTKRGAPAEAASKHMWSERQPANGSKAANVDATGPALFDGTLAVWKVDARYEHSSAIDGKIAARHICLDEYGTLLDDFVAPPGEAKLPSGTSTVAVEGRAEQREHVSGWSRKTPLTMIARGVYAGHCITVSTQNGGRLHQRGKLITRGLVTADELLRSNRVQVVGALAPGWIQTVFTEGIQVVAIEFDDPTGRHTKPPIVQIACGDKPGAGKTVEVTPIKICSRDGKTLLEYAVPGKAPFVTVTIIAAVDVRGVYGAGCSSEFEPGDMPELACAGVQPRAGISEHSILTLRRASGGGAI